MRNIPLDTDRQRKFAWAGDDQRFFALKRAGLYRLKDSPVWAFELAATYGELLDADGTTKTHPRGRTCPGSVILADRRDLILEDLGLKETTWNEYVRRWQRARMAHRCKGGAVCLFSTPLDAPDAVCPSARCGQRLPTPSEHRNDSMRDIATIRWKRRNDSLRAPSTEDGINGVGVKVSSPTPDQREGQPPPSHHSSAAEKRGAARFDGDAWEEGDDTEEVAP